MIHKDGRKIRISGKVLTEKELIKSLEQIQKEKREKSEMRKKKVASCSTSKDNTLKQLIPPPNIPTFPMFIPFIGIQPKPPTVLPQPPLHFPNPEKEKQSPMGKSKKRKRD